MPLEFLIDGPHFSVPQRAPGAVIVISSPKGTSEYGQQPGWRRETGLIGALTGAGNAAKGLFNSGLPWKDRILAILYAVARIVWSVLIFILNLVGALVKAIQRTEWGSRLFQSSESYYLVDVSRHGLECAFEIPSKDDSLYFKVSVRFDAQIKNPAKAVDQGISDLSAYVRTGLERLLAGVGNRYSVQQSLAARDAMQAALDAWKGDDVVRVLSSAIDVRQDETERPLVRAVAVQNLEKSAIEATASVDEAARGHQKKILASPEDLLAQWLRTKDPAYREALTAKLSALQTENDRKLAIFDLLSQKGFLKDFDIHESDPNFISNLIKALSQGVTSQLPQLPQLPGAAAPEANAPPPQPPAS